MVPNGMALRSEVYGAAQVLFHQACSSSGFLVGPRPVTPPTLLASPPLRILRQRNTVVGSVPFRCLCAR